MSIVKSFFLILILILVFISLNLLPINWYLLPLFLGGILSFNKIIQKTKSPDYLNDTFFYVWIVFFLTTFVAPLIHFSRDYWIENVYILPRDWSSLSLITSSILLFGMLVFYFMEKLPVKEITQKQTWKFKNNAGFIIVILMFISFILQTLFYLKNGGIIGVIKTYSDRDVMSEGNFAGFGLYFIFSEIFPYLLLLLYFIHARNKTTSLIRVLIFLLLMFISALYFGGLRGSRSNTVMTMFQAILLIHFSIYRFKRVHFIVMITAFFLFMIIGRIYKSEGINFIENYNEYEDYQISKKTSSVESIIITDLTRYNILTYEIFMLENNPHYQYKMGSTYLASILTFIPWGSPIKDQLDLTTRTEAAGQLMFNYDGQQRTLSRKNTRIFGFIGESILNFGYISILFSFFALYLCLTLIKLWSISITNQDARYYFISLLPVLVINLIDSDSNNVAFFVVKRIILMYLIIWTITFKTKENINGSGIYH